MSWDLKQTIKKSMVRMGRNSVKLPEFVNVDDDGQNGSVLWLREFYRSYVTVVMLSGIH